MVSEKPPRHSKSKAEPVTIDLDPKDVKREADEPQQANDKAAAATPNKASSVSEPVKPVASENTSPQADEPSDAKKPEGIGAAQWSEGPDVKLSNSDNQGAPNKPAIGAAASTIKTGTGPTSTGSTSSSNSFGKSQIPPRREEPKASISTPPASTGTSASGAAAAGIFGGLIALLAAGSLQYAGYVPGANSSNSESELANLRSEIAALKQSVSEQQTAQPQFDSSALEQRLASLESSNQPQTIGLDGVDGLSSKLSSYESQLEQLKAALADASSTNKSLTERMTAAEEKINEPRDDIEVARAIAAAALKAAIDRGGPFLTELDTLVQVTPEDEQLKALQPFASTGVPSRSEILKSFPTEANQILSELNQPDPNLGIVKRLTHSAMSLVRVRPVGNVAGDTAEAVIARIEDKLRNGDLKGAALEWDALPVEAKTTGDAFKKSLDARVHVEELVGSAVTRALTKNQEQG